MNYDVRMMRGGYAPSIAMQAWFSVTEQLSHAICGATIAGDRAVCGLRIRVLRADQPPVGAHLTARDQHLDFGVGQ
jgi:hypothetical protein